MAQPRLRTVQDIAIQAKLEMQSTLKRRLSSDKEFYFFYQKTTAEHDGGFTIRATEPPNPDFQNIAMRLRRDQTEEQNLYQFMQVAIKLPILSI